MTTKNYLLQARQLNYKITNKMYEKDQLKSLLTSVSSPVKDVNVQISGSSDRIGDTVCKIIMLEQEIDKLIDNYVDTKNHIIQQMEQLDFKYYQVLFYRYVMERHFEAIAQCTGYTLRHVKRLHAEAVEHFEQKFGDEYL